jgi:hypothetical protein
LKQDDIEYAIENTQVILAPERQIATFGNTSFEFHLISELMDRVDQVRIRTGRIEAERPKILSPEYFCRMMLEGFGEKAQEYVERLREHAQQIAVLRYGFQFRKSGVTEETVSASLQSVIDRTRRVVESASDPNGAIIQGVDEAWEVCLLKFTIEMIERSAGEKHRRLQAPRFDLISAAQASRDRVRHPETRRRRGTSRVQNDCATEACVPQNHWRGPSLALRMTERGNAKEFCHNCK